MKGGNVSNWLDLSAIGARLTALRFADGRIRLVLTGFEPGSADWNWAIAAEGFRPSRSSTFLFREGGAVKFAPFLDRFSSAKVIQVPVSQIVQLVDGASRSPLSDREHRASLDAKTVRELGLNHAGQQVNEGATGRYVLVRSGEATIPVPEDPKAPSARFLRAPDDAQLALCADGLVERMMRGQVLHSDDLREFASIVFEDGRRIDIHDARLRRAQEAVEAAMQRRLERDAKEPDREAFDLAVMMTERQPTFAFRTSSSVEHQQYSTVLPLAIAAQRLLRADPGDEVLEPTIGNGSLVSKLAGGVRITGVEIDPVRARQVSSLRPGLDVIEGDVLSVGFDRAFDKTIANPPFGGLKEPVVVDGLRVTRIDHLIVLKALQARRDEGRSVFIIGADRANIFDKHAGLIQGGSKYFFNWLADHYDVESVVELDGKLYAKQGSSYPVRLVVVGARRTPEAALEAGRTGGHRLPERVPVLRSWEELWAHADRSPAVADVQAKAGLDATGEEDWFAEALHEAWNDGFENTQADQVSLVKQDLEQRYGRELSDEQVERWMVEFRAGGEEGRLADDGPRRLEERTPREVQTPDDGVVKVFGSAMRGLGLQMDGLDPREWSLDLASGHEVHARLSSDDREVWVYRFEGGQLVDEAKLEPSADATRKVQEYIQIAMRAPAVRQEFMHNGVRIYPTTVKVGEKIKDLWAVESADNKARREAGERHGFGDTLHESPDLAREAADQQRARAAEEARYAAEVTEAENARKAAEDARKADTCNGFLEGRAENTKALIRKALDKQYRFDGVVMSVRERIEALHSAGKIAISTIEEPKIKPMSRAQFNRATQAEQDAHERRMREAGMKTVYLVNDSDLGKYAYDYAQHLLSTGLGPNAETARPDTEAEQEGPSQRVENHFQAPYSAASRIGEATAMVPRNLVAPISAALDALEERSGAVDDFVATKLQYELDDLPRYFSPEQIDAIALAIDASDKGRALINGDQTGQGKGRVVAAMARYAALRGWPIVFMTEKANLFSDLWRDIEDIDSTALFKPFMVNDGVEIRSQDNERAFAPTRKKEVDRLISEFTSPDDAGFNLTFATYSQVNRAADGSKKAQWFVECAAKSAFLILDESHNAAGQSNTAENVATAILNARSAMYSSATYAKTAKSMRAYAKAFPEGVCDDNLAETLAVGGEPLQEILSGMLARDGVFIRREHDLSRLRFDTHRDVAHKERNRAFADQLSEVLLAMSYLSGDIDEMVARLKKDIKERLEGLSAEQRKGNRMNVSRASFGSRLFALQRQALLIMKVDEAVAMAAEALAEGRKPVIVLEQTQEALVREVIEKTLALGDADDEFEDELEAARRLSAAIGGSVEIPMVTFKDVLYRVLDKLDVITERNAYGVVSKTTAVAKAANKEEAEAWVDSKNRIARLIDQLPDLPCSPIDLIRQQLEDRGFSCGELTGRGIQLSVLEDKMVVMPRVDNRLETIHNFQNGRLDAVIVSRAGSTGISLHASDKCEDQRQRELIELEIAQDVNARVQFFGRVNRRGQTSSPRIRTISSDMPSEARVLAMQNAKLRKLSANTQSDRENAAEAKDVVDVINHIGDEICRKFLENNPDIARMLDIELGELDTETLSADDAWFANKLMGRLGLLRYDEQERILGEISAEYEATMMDLERLGVNPFRANEYDWKARVVSRELFHGSEQEVYASEFDKPVYLTTLEWEEDRAPLRAADVEKVLEKALDELERDGRCSVDRLRAGTPSVSYGALLRTIRERFDGADGRPGLKVMAKPREFDSVTAALESPTDNAVKRIQKRQDYLEATLAWIKPGERVSFMDEGDAMIKGKIVGVDLPVKGREHLLAQYQVKVAVPGEEKPITFTLARLQELGMERVFTLDPENAYSSKGDAYFFDAVPAGKVTLQRFVLDGNLFKAAQIAAEQNLGMAGIYTNERGERERGVVLWKRVGAEDVKAVPVKIERKELALALINRYKGLAFYTTPTSDTKNGLRLRLEPNGRVAVSVHGSKAHGGKWYLDKRLTAITGEFSGGRDMMGAVFHESDLPAFVDALYQAGNAFYVPASKRDELNALMQSALTEALGQAPQGAPRRAAAATVVG